MGMLEEALSSQPVPEPVQPAHIGGWGQTDGAPEVELEYVTVDYFNTRISVLADPLSMELIMEEFLDLAAQIDETDEVRAIGAVRTFLRAMIKPSDFGKFWAAVKANRQDVIKQMEFGRYLIEAVTGHPTERQSGSSPGLPQTPPSSEDALSLRVQEHFEGVGRPDLAEAVLLRREFTHAQQAG